MQAVAARLRFRFRPRMPQNPGIIASALFLAFLIGTVSAFGVWVFGLVLIGMIAATLVAFAHPERSALALIALLPFMIAPLRAGEFNIFLGVPFGFMVGVSLLLRCRGSRTWRQPHLLGFGVLVLLGFMIASTIASADPLRGASRCVSVTVFATFAAGLGTAIASERISIRAVARAFLFGATFAAVALIIQFGAQFVVGEGRVMNSLRDLAPWFTGLNGVGHNWRQTDFGVLRAVFPFMVPASAGQYMAVGMVAASWFWMTAPRNHGDRKLAGIAFALMSVALIVTFSRQSWIGAGVGLGVLILRQDRGAMIALATPLLVMLMFAPLPGMSSSLSSYFVESTESKSATERISFWEEALDYTEQRPTLGIGPGQYATLGNDPTHRKYAHNVFLDQFVELGIPGALVWIALALGFIGLAWRRRATLALGMMAAFLTANMFDDVFYFPRNGLALAVAVGLAAAIARRPAVLAQMQVERAPPPPAREPAVLSRV